jgi:hypothetical protein
MSAQFMKSRFLPFFQQSNNYLFKGEVNMIPLSTVVWHYTFKAVISRFFKKYYNDGLPAFAWCPINHKKERQAISSLMSLVLK